MSNSADLITDALLALRTAISDGLILTGASFTRSEENLDAILDARDGDPRFEAEWMRVSRELTSLKEASSVWSEYGPMVDGIRESAFLTVSRATQQHEVASYVSDDFDLIAAGVVLRYTDAWLNGLWSQYREHSIACPPVAPIEGDLLVLVGNLGAAPN